MRGNKTFILVKLSLSHIATYHKAAVRKKYETRINFMVKRTAYREMLQFTSETSADDETPDFTGTQRMGHFSSE